MSESLFGLGSLVSDSGRTRFSGAGGGFPTQDIVEASLAPDRERIDRIETQVEETQFETEALENLRSRVSDVESAARQLSNQPSVDGAGNVFEAKALGQAATSRFDTQTASAPEELIGVTLDNSAQAQDHRLEVLQTAQAEQLTSKSFTSPSDGSLTAFSDGDTFEIQDGAGNSSQIQLNASDSLVDVRDKINNADVSASASTVEVSDNDFRLTINSDETGQSNTLTLSEPTGTPLQDLGVLDGSGAKNVSQEARNARFTADNVKEQESSAPARSERVSDTSQSLQNLGFVDSSGGTLTISDNGGSLGSVSLEPGKSLDQLATDISNKVTDVTATITADNELEVSSDTGSNLTFDDGGSNFLASSNLDDEIFERQSNTADDVFEGVTLNLRQAEDGTTIDLPVERDLTGVKETIQNLVDSFNSAQQFINAQRQEAQLEGQSEDTTGVLADEPVLDDIEQRLGRAVSGVAQNVDTDFSVLREIGINFVDNENVSDPTQFDTLEIEDSELDNALSQNFESVRDLFGFDLRADDPDLTMLDFGSQTGAVSDFTLDVETDGNGDIDTSNTSLTNGDGNTVAFDATDEEGNPSSSLEVTEGSAEGLVLSFNEPGANRTINFDTSRGIGADSLFTSQNIATSDDTGVIQSAVQTREDQNSDRNDRVNRLETQLQDERERLLDRFSSVEGTLAQLGQQQQILQARLGN